MRHDEALSRQATQAQAWRAFPVKRIAIFGSVARDEAGEGSDVDILVEFLPDAHVGLFEFVRLQRTLSDLLDARVDLATPDALREEMREQILREAIDAA